MFNQTNDAVQFEREYEEHFGRPINDRSPLYEHHRLWISKPEGAKVDLSLRSAKLVTPDAAMRPRAVRGRRGGGAAGGVRKAAGTPAGVTPRVSAAGAVSSSSDSGSDSDTSASSDGSPDRNNQTSTHQPLQPPPDSSPDSPFHITDTMTVDTLLGIFDDKMMGHFSGLLWRPGVYLIPPFPRTTAAANRLQTAVDRLLQSGHTNEALVLRVVRGCGA